MKSVADILAERQAKAEQGDWYPASGGTETPFTTATGRRVLYCWQPSTGRHAYLDLGTDFILSDEEAGAALGYLGSYPQPKHIQGSIGSTPSDSTKRQKTKGRNE